MFRSLRKAASSLEASLETVFSSPPTSHTAFSGTTLKFDNGMSVRLGEVIAEGGYSFIHIATPLQSSSTTKRYAVKRMVCGNDHDNDDGMKEIQHEIKVLETLRQYSHANIVCYYGHTYRNGNVFLLFELIDGGTLPDRLLSITKHKKQKIQQQQQQQQQQHDEHQLLNIFTDIVNAVAHIHSIQSNSFDNNIMAIRDVKLENVLYDRITKRYKLCDFGSVTTCTYMPNQMSRSDVLLLEDEISRTCTAMYRAPELADLYSGYFICERVDVWALGCIWYAILFGTLPFDGSSMLQICNGLNLIPNTPKYPTCYIDVLKKCLTVDPACRPDVFTVLKALRTIQGQSMKMNDIDQSIVDRIRRKRRKDFGKESACVEIPVVIEGKQNVSRHVSIMENKSNRYCHEDNEDDEDWSDFQSAFAEENASSNNKNMCASSIGVDIQRGGINTRAVAQSIPPSSSHAHRHIAHPQKYHVEQQQLHVNSQSPILSNVTREAAKFETDMTNSYLKSQAKQQHEQYENAESQGQSLIDFSDMTETTTNCTTSSAHADEQTDLMKMLNDTSLR